VFIGHNAVGFGSKGAARRTSLGLLMAAPMLLDLIWPIFLLLGIEHLRIPPIRPTKFTPLEFNDYPWSHSLAMCVVWAVLFAGVYFWRTRYTAGAVTLFFGVVSHWVLDFVTHAPDLPLWPGGPKVGLGLWNYPVATIAIECALFTIGIFVYRGVTEPVDVTGSVSLWGLIVTLALIYIVNAGSPPPTNVRYVAYSALALYLVPLWAAWIDRHRELRE
jgi:membrane-bound metal-dependent hydrolase YbcI (DUF457 family)